MFDAMEEVLKFPYISHGVRSGFKWDYTCHLSLVSRLYEDVLDEYSLTWDVSDEDDFIRFMNASIALLILRVVDQDYTNFLTEKGKRLGLKRASEYVPSPSDLAVAAAYMEYADELVEDYFAGDLNISSDEYRAIDYIAETRVGFSPLLTRAAETVATN